MERVPFWRRYLRLFGPDPAADAREEVQFHIAAKADDLEARGWTREAAECEALRQFGDRSAIEKVGEQLGREGVRHARRRDFRGAFAQDLRYAVRTLRKDRAFAIITVAVLALGIAANTAVFSVVDAVLLRPLPFPKAGELAWFTSARRAAAAGRDVSGLSDVTYTVAAYEEYQRHNHAFAQVAVYDPFLGDTDFTMVGRGEPQPVAGVTVSQNFFPTLGVRPAFGRLFTPEQCRPKGPPAILLSHTFWKNRLGGDPAIVGQSVTLRQGSGSGAATVIGVLPESFDFGAVFAPGINIDIFVPAVLDEMRNMGNTLAVVGRLNPGITVAQAQAEADIVWPQIHAAHKDWWGDYTSTISPLKEHVSGKLRRSLVLLWGAVGVMLLIVCVNLSNLMLARGAARSKEFALRSALGAGRGRLVLQMLTEGSLLAAAGATAGLALAFAVVRYLAHQGSLELPLLSSVQVDAAALGWTLALTAGVALLFGIVPGLNAPRGNLQEPLRDGGHGTTVSRKHERVRAALVVSEVALACMLLVGAGLLLRSLANVMNVDLGFQPSRAVVIQVDYDDGGKLEKRGPVLQAMVHSVESIPGVEVAGIADMLPLGRNRSWGFLAKGHTYPKNVELGAMVRIVTPGYLPAMGMHLTEGRDFAWSDSAAGERVVIINQAAARRFWQGEDPVGRVAVVGGPEARVIGVVADVRQHSAESAPGPEMYLPAMQRDPEGAHLVLRSKLPPEALAASVMRSLRALNPSQPATILRPLEEIVDRSVSPRRFIAWLVGAFAALGMLLAALGVYGVISYSVTRQTQEIGVRIALGAGALRVQSAVIGRAMRLALAGIAIGIAASLIGARWIESLLFGTGPADPVTLAAIPAILGAVALIAAWVPARRASRVDPMVALRAGN